MRKIVKAASFTLFIFGLLGWLYIAAISLVHSETLPIQLTHFATYLSACNAQAERGRLQSDNAQAEVFKVQRVNNLDRLVNVI